MKRIWLPRPFFIYQSLFCVIFLASERHLLTFNKSQSQNLFWTFLCPCWLFTGRITKLPRSLLISTFPFFFHFFSILLNALHSSSAKPTQLPHFSSLSAASPFPSLFLILCSKPVCSRGRSVTIFKCGVRGSAKSNLCQHTTGRRVTPQQQRRERRGRMCACLHNSRSPPPPPHRHRLLN